MKVSNVMITEKVNLDKFVNSETGETMASQLSAATQVTVSRPAGKKRIEYDNFVGSDTEVDEYVLSILSPMDYMRYRKMACRLHTDFNVVLSKNNWPHTLQSLSTALNISVDETTRLIRRLEKIGLVRWHTIEQPGFPKKVLAFNPYAISKRNRFDENMLSYFPNFSEIRKSAVPPAPPKKKRLQKKLPAA